MAWRSLVVVAIVMSACSSGENALENYGTRMVTLPDGAGIRCEVMNTPADMARGMMYRDSLAEDRGMLFFHAQSGPHEYWMFNVKIPLDMIWLDANGRIVELAPNAQPCLVTDSSQCPTYGGGADSITVLELAGGSIERHGLAMGQQIQF